MDIEEVTLGDKISVFKPCSMIFYMQKAYLKDWIDNSHNFTEVEDVIQFYGEHETLDLPSKYNSVITEVSFLKENFY